MGDGMRERPILMTPENAQKCHDGTKTQTRRIVKYHPSVGEPNEWCHRISEPVFINIMGDYIRICPYGVVGGRLWVREAWAWPGEEAFLYKGIPADARLASEWQKDLNCCQLKWMPSIHMPRMACRTVLEITDVRVERLKNISSADALAEGVFCPEIGYAQYGDRAPVMQYGFLWESIHGVGSWEKNPWVWVISFRKVG